MGCSASTSTAAVRPPTCQDAPGCVCLGRYAVNPQKILGSGGQGKVYLARDRKNKNEQVAVKRSSVETEKGRKALQLEASIMSELNHPNICRLLEFHEKGDTMFFVMELCSGGDLADRLMKEGQIAECQTLRILRQVTDALAHAHGRGIAHRDLKPENICLSGAFGDEVKLIDWGLSSYFRADSMTGCTGSATYTAPEVLESYRSGRPYSQACDLWSLGVVAYTMLMGRFPFWGCRDELIKAMKKDKIPTPEPMWSSVSSDSKSFIRSLVRYKAEERLDMEAVQAHPWLSGRRTPAPAIAPAAGRPVSQGPTPVAAVPKPMAEAPGGMPMAEALSIEAIHEVAVEVPVPPVLISQRRTIALGEGE